MKELKIYEFQAKNIEKALTLSARILKSRQRVTCADRDIMSSLEMIKNVLDGDPDRPVSRIEPTREDMK